MLLGYLERGASAIRLDAIGFLWKESGTTCIHLPQTHAVIKLWRALVEHVAPGARLLTETNVPHAENISYFGDGGDEAHLVYQFALPPLVLHSFVAGSTARLSDWARGVGPVSDTATWFNFLASHDGIGLRATEGILNDAERLALVERTEAHGGRVSMASRPDGTSAVYELNLSYLDALCTPAEAVLPRCWRPRRWPRTASCSPSSACRPSTTTRSSALPRTTRAWRPPTSTAASTARCSTPTSSSRSLESDPRRHAVFTGMRHLLEVRRGQPAFSPFGTQQVEHLDDRVFAVRRGAGTPDELLCLTNVTGSPVRLPGVGGYDVVSGTSVDELELAAYGFVWLRST